MVLLVWYYWCGTTGSTRAPGVHGLSGRALTCVMLSLSTRWRTGKNCGKTKKHLLLSITWHLLERHLKPPKVETFKTKQVAALNYSQACHNMWSSDRANTQPFCEGVVIILCSWTTQMYYNPSNLTLHTACQSQNDYWIFLSNSHFSHSGSSLLATSSRHWGTETESAWHGWQTLTLPEWLFNY